MSKKIRLQHLIIQPVLLVDDGEELVAGPELAPITLIASQVPLFLKRLPKEIAELQTKIDEQEQDLPSSK